MISWPMRREKTRPPPREGGASQGNVWYAIPSTNPARARASLALWKAQGYKTALLVDRGQAEAFAPAEADILYAPFDVYPGYFRSVISLASMLVALVEPATIVVTGGDDMRPDPKRTASELEVEFFEHFPDGFGVMQPIGDKMHGTNRICGSPWFGRAWIRRAYGGRGPVWPGYRQFFGDEELRHVTTKLGVLWDRPDVEQYHDHHSRMGGPPKTDYQKKNDEHWNVDKDLYQRRLREGWPSHEPVAP